MGSNNIQLVIDDLLCCGCGACKCICHKDAIQLIRLPSGFLSASVDDTKCINCGLCLKVCPSNRKDELCLYGKAISTISGCAKDEDTRANGQSGGLCTEILLFLINNRLIDGAVVTRLSNGKPESVFTNDVVQIQQAAGSVYAQTSVVEAVLKNKEKKMAVVALGCQARAIRNAMSIYPGLRERVLIIGLICGGNMSLMMYDELIKQSRLKGKSIGLVYRDKKNTGWPGNPTCSNGQHTVILDKDARIRLKPLYECYRCTVCPEKMNINCDILLGDPWGVVEDQVKEGNTVAISYTKRGDDILKMAATCLDIHDIEFNRVLEGQKIESDYLIKLKKIASKNGQYSHPYQFGDLDSIVMDSELQDKLEYEKRLYTSSSLKEAKRIVKARKRKLYPVLREWLYSVKRKVLLILRRRINE